MDDLLPGVIIEGVLGVNLTDCRGFKSQMDNRISADNKEIRNMVYTQGFIQRLGHPRIFHIRHKILPLLNYRFYRTLY